MNMEKRTLRAFNAPFVRIREAFGIYGWGPLRLFVSHLCEYPQLIRKYQVDCLTDYQRMKKYRVEHM